KPEDLVPRSPVITVMGHVDHGKTTFLDRVRSANVAGGEAGGITQHIAAYDVPIGNGRVVFLDTPGHEAFTAMRARGAQCTDVVVLVVAADDGVMPQTVEAIDHAKAAEVPIVVAVNKIDKPDAQPERIRQELIRYDLMDEAWGGKTIIKDISAKQGTGVEELLELLLLQAEMLELKANPNKPARGTIIESEISRGQGPVAWVLVQSGTLRVGDNFLAGEAYGRVRSMHTARGENIQEAGPSTPIVVTGFSAPPNAGDTFLAVADERTARVIAEKRANYSRLKQGAGVRRVTLEDFHDHLKAGEKNFLNVLLKADVQGSVDVFESSLAKAGTEEVQVKVVHSGVGGINESDVMLASASNAVIIGFHVTASPKAQKLAETQGVDVRTYRIIYEAIQEVRLALEGMLAPESKEIVTGHVEIRQVFRSSALGNIAGCYVLDGEITRTSLVRLTRDGVVVHEGKLGSLKRNKDDARTVAAGFECGIKLDGYEDIKPGDVIESYRIEAVKRTLE
ncbi:MAG TPA: translation initiation factor IF-2, partial [Candidatus Hydrogenedentes bacterium]|nr:translation initiation factor IF-2 [Candidatus Hydrogenedentota bacterium]